MQLVSVPLSRLIPSKRNPRRVKPAREAHQRLVALIRAHGLVHPLVVQPSKEKPKHFLVMIGNRRLAALREVHHNNGDPRIPCTIRKADEKTEAALSLGENFGREPMHPIDEADAFAGLASDEGKGAAAIASEFGVPERYVRQRMKLASLAQPIKTAYRANGIDTATAEAFAAVREERQLEVWKELGGTPRNAEHVHNVIARSWIDAKLASFDLSTVPASAISTDLFSETVLVERRAFMDAQAAALAAQRQQMTEEGWSEVVIAKREDVQDRLLSMNTMEFDEETRRRLEKLASRRQKLAAKYNDADGSRATAALQMELDGLEADKQKILAEMPRRVAEETKAVATAFLVLDPDGTVHRHYRVPRPSRGRHEDGERAKVPTSDDLSDTQRAVTFTHQALVVREALSRDRLARKRILVLALHEKVRSEALSIRHEANGTTLHASQKDFASDAFGRIKTGREKLDPFTKKHHVDDVEGYDALSKLPERKLDALIDALVVDLLTAHPVRSTALVSHLAAEFKATVRDDWRPDADWLGSYQKLQLGHLVTELKGPVHAPAPDRKKSNLVMEIAKLFTDAAHGKLEDKALEARLNTWLPANLRTSSGKKNSA